MSPTDLKGMDQNGRAIADPPREATRPVLPDPLRRHPIHTYAALDLGTNNCRLLVARPAREGFRIVDAFFRIVRLGEGVSASGKLGEEAIRRTLGALEICRDKMDIRGVTRARLIATEACRMADNWASLQLGVVTLAETFGGVHVTREVFDAMVAHVAGALADFRSRVEREVRCDAFHLLGTSGTVTTLAGVHLGLLRYDRRRVDGLWMSDGEIDRALDLLRAMSYDERVANGCIGAERADLVLAGCAILEAIRQAFPARRVRIADRGLREGILAELMSADGVWRDGDKGREQRR